MQGQMIQTNLNNGKAQAAQGKHGGFVCVGKGKDLSGMFSALAALSLAKASELKQQTN